MNYSEIVTQINNVKGLNCFKMPEESELTYFKSIELPNEVLNFYSQYSPINTIEINSIRLLPIAEIIEENTNYTPGYLLLPLGFCTVASTIEGDIYCIKKTIDDYSVVIASHDEIYEGQSVDQTLNGVKLVTQTLAAFLNAFVRRDLVSSFYDLKEE